jgi:hypothetical protein
MWTTLILADHESSDFWSDASWTPLLAVSANLVAY